MKKIILLIYTLTAISCGENSLNESISEKDKLQNIQNGDIDFIDTLSKSKNSENIQPEKTQETTLEDEGWEISRNENGTMPSCYNFSPKRSKIDNSLRVYVGNGTDVVIKIMDLNSDKCIRFVFINSGTSFSIQNIPEGQYYLKIAYGKNWFTKKVDGKCIGKFTSNPLYEKGEDILDFNLQHTNNGYSIPSYELELDVISTNPSNSFNSTGISEDLFNH